MRTKPLSVGVATQAQRKPNPGGAPPRDPPAHPAAQGNPR